MVTVEREQNSLLEGSRAIVDLIVLLENLLRNIFFPMNDPIKTKTVTAEFFEVYKYYLE